MADHPPEWAASSTKPGMAYIDVMDYTQNDLRFIKSHIDAVRPQVDLVVMSLHWGSNYCWRPPKTFQRFAKELIDMGVDMVCDFYN